jgi:hypothetical protein
VADTEVQCIESSTLQVNGVDLDDLINEVAEQSDANLKDVNTMNKAGEVRAFKQGNIRLTLQVKAERIVDARVPDWFELMRTKTYFRIAVRYNIGRPRSYFSCRVNNISETSTEGDSSLSLTIRARRRKDG